MCSYPSVKCGARRVRHIVSAFMQWKACGERSLVDESTDSTLHKKQKLKTIDIDLHDLLFITNLFRIIELGAQKDLHHDQTALGAGKRGTSVFHYKPMLWVIIIT